MIQLLTAPFKPPIVRYGQIFGILGSGLKEVKTIKICNKNLDFMICNDNLITLFASEGLESGFAIINDEIKSNIKLVILNNEGAIVREEQLKE